MTAASPYIPAPEKSDQGHLLLADNYSPHLSDESRDIVTQECNGDLILIPTGCTSLVQPMDMSINCPFKVRMQELWVAWFRSHTSITCRGNLKQPIRQDAINWVSTAWAAEIIQ